MTMRTVAKIPDHIITKAIDAYQRQPVAPHPCPACGGNAALSAALPDDMPEPLRELALRHAELERQEGSLARRGGRSSGRDRRGAGSAPRYVA